MVQEAGRKCCQLDKMEPSRVRRKVDDLPQVNFIFETKSEFLFNQLRRRHLFGSPARLASASLTINLPE